MKYMIVWMLLVGAAWAKPGLDFEYLLEKTVDAKGETDSWNMIDIDDFFKIFAKEEITDYLNNLKPSLPRSIDFLRGIPCVQCMQHYLQCKSVCSQLVPESKVYFFDQFACYSVCWQKVVSCCVAASRTRMKLAEEADNTQSEGSGSNTS